MKPLVLSSAPRLSRISTKSKGLNCMACLREGNRHYWNEESMWGIRFKMKILNLCGVRPNDVELWKPEHPFSFLPHSIFGHKKWSLLLSFVSIFTLPLPVHPKGFKEKGRKEEGMPSFMEHQEGSSLWCFSISKFRHKTSAGSFSGSAGQYPSGNSTEV